MPEFCEAKSHLRSTVRRMKMVMRSFSRTPGLLREESYITPVASSATALFEQGRNI